ncbi:MAG: hypothetical protein KDD56_06970, partial [Bdellovibrionales bacterium]|nr:hypothetical protein [Bdellovibrionales bacterium]
MSSEKSPSGFKNKDIENKFSEVIHELEIFDKELDESHFLSSNEVSQALFHKAPANFLKSNSSNRLAEIAKTA